MAKQKKITTSTGEKSPTIFDVIAYLTFKKKPWIELTSIERKLFNPYMINRFLSMDLDLVQLINELQKYTLGKMEKEQVYNLYFHLLPQMRLSLNYIKSKNSISEEDLDVLYKYFKLSEDELEDYYNILMKDKEGQEFFKSIKANYQYDEK